MTQKDLLAWRDRCGFSSWDEAASALGISRATMYRVRRQRKIARLVELATIAVEGMKNGGYRG